MLQHIGEGRFIEFSLLCFCSFLNIFYRSVASFPGIGIVSYQLQEVLLVVNVDNIWYVVSIVHQNFVSEPACDTYRGRSRHPVSLRFY